MSLSVATAALGVGTGNARVLALCGLVTMLTTVSAGIKVLARLSAIAHAMIKSLTVVALENNTIPCVILGNLNLTIDAHMSLF